MPEEKPNAQIDYDAVLQELYAKRDEMDGAISTILLLKGSGATTPESTSRRVIATNGGSIPSNAFFGLGIGDAARKYMEMIQAKRTVPQITKALEDGGMPPQKPNTVYAALRRREVMTGDITRVGEEWGLKEWFSNIAKPKATKKGKATKSKKKASKKLGKIASPKQESPSKPEPTKAKQPMAESQKADKPISNLNAVHEILTSADKPLHADVLVEKLKADYGKDTNVKSIAASLPQDATKRFYNVGNNTWALETWRGTSRVKPKAVAATA